MAQLVAEEITVPMAPIQRTKVTFKMRFRIRQQECISSQAI